MKCLLCIRTVLSNVDTEVKKADKNPNSHKVTNLGGQSMEQQNQYQIIIKTSRVKA